MSKRVVWCRLGADAHPPVILSLPKDLQYPPFLTNEAADFAMLSPGAMLQMPHMILEILRQAQPYPCN